MLVLLSGVSGAGKDTIKKELIKRMEEVESLPSFTSINPRVGEEEGIQYHFITKEQFEDLRKYTKDIIKQISKEILSGNIEINPYYQKKNKKTPCDYCEYKQICNFKENNNCSYRYIENLKKEEILESIREEKEEW